jgi:hypothetical protein
MLPLSTQQLVFVLIFPCRLLFIMPKVGIVPGVQFGWWKDQSVAQSCSSGNKNKHSLTKELHIHNLLKATSF